MPLRNGRALRHVPSGCSDTVDSTNSAPGAMLALLNLVQDPSTAGVYVPRPGATELFDLDVEGGLGDPIHPPAPLGTPRIPPGFISALLVVGDLAFGMVATQRNPGRDEPFCVNLGTQQLVPVAGVTVDNTPISPPAAGDWTPPILAQVGSRIVVCHPGFPGGAYKVGWFDISGFSESVFGNTGAGIGSGNFITGNPSILGVQPGMTLSGANIPVGTTVVSTANITHLTTGDTNSNVHLTGIASTAQVAVGQLVFGVGIPAGAVVTVIVGPNAVDISSPATATATGISLTFVGTLIKMSNYATAAADGTAIKIAGGASPVPYPIIANSTTGSVTLNGNPAFLVNQVGAVITGPGIPPGTTITTYGLDSLVTTGDTHSGTTTLDNLASIAGVAIGQTVEGIGIAGGTVVAAIVSGTAITLSQPAISSNAVTAIRIAGVNITLSQAASAGGNNLTFMVTGTPLWGAGDTDHNNLPSVPLAVAQYNGRAYYACGIFGILFSDSGFPTRISNTTAVQVLTTNDGLAVTMIAPLQLSTLLGGIVQSLVAFEGTNKMQQITGDLATNNLTMNALPVATGTNAPLSCAPFLDGLAFVSPDGLRYIDFQGKVSDPIGASGSGIAVPFINSMFPSRMCAAANRKYIRITTENSTPVDLKTKGGVDTGWPSPATQEWWFNIATKQWTGPHTCAASLIQPWRESFAMTFVSGGGPVIYDSDPTPHPGSVYEELGLQMQWIYATSLLPDSGDMAMTEVAEMLLTAQLPGGQIPFAYATSDWGEQLDVPQPQGIWGKSVWSKFIWGRGGAPIEADAGTGTFRQRQIAWDVPLIFKQASIQVNGYSVANLRVGNLYMRYQRLGYPVRRMVA